ncbi:doublesex- and mab-3-related transcription factor B1 [Peromyscus californicus insignis]|uniref:doublesex- and mab-3-related transcription factor B1 n=1 Tax=Peromyscus californicus insignis TaxID=564181 RepID=UPI0022A7068A|nr:doublesex- and mab-3-related transcription factor B1 [Peromyscus californicus insignis]
MLRTPKCSRCRNHGYLVPVKGHAGKCRWKQCICDKCYLITERQKIMAAQKVLKTQGTEEQAATGGTQGPQLPPGAPVAAPAAAAAAAATASSSSSLCPQARVAPGGAGPGPVATCFLERPPQACSPGPSAFQLVPGGRPGPSTFQPALGSPGGPHDRPSAWLPPASPQPPRPESCGPEPRLPLRPVPRLPFTDYGHPLRFSSDRVGGAGYPEREPFQQCPACVPMPSYQPFPPDGQAASSALGIPQQRSFRHVSCSPYHGGSLVSEPARDLQPTYCSPPPPPLPPPPPQPPQQSNFLPSGYLSALHLLAPPPPPPSPPSFSLTILYDTDKEDTNDQDAEALTEPSQHSSQEQSN